MQYLKTKLSKFSGGGPPDPPNHAALLTCIFIFPASRRGHHASRGCHLSFDFMSQPPHRLLHPGLWHPRLLYALFSNLDLNSGLRHPRPPVPFLGALHEMVMTARRLTHFSGFFLKVHFDPCRSGRLRLSLLCQAVCTELYRICDCRVCLGSEWL